MTKLESLTEPLVRLFVRIDAARPTDEVLCVASDFWWRQRQDRIMPEEGQMADVPASVAPHVFIARTMTDGSRHWLISSAGPFASSLLQLAGEGASALGEKHIAVRLRRLFDLVSEKSEPYSAMFETNGQSGQRNFVEVFAAPLKAVDKSVYVIFAAVNSRAENAR